MTDADDVFTHPPSLPALRRPITVCSFCDAEIPPEHQAEHWRNCEKHPAGVEVKRLMTLCLAWAGQAEAVQEYMWKEYTSDAEDARADGQISAMIEEMRKEGEKP